MRAMGHIRWVILGAILVVAIIGGGGAGFLGETHGQPSAPPEPPVAANENAAGAESAIPAVWAEFATVAGITDEAMQQSTARPRNMGPHALPTFDAAWENWHAIDVQADAIAAAFGETDEGTPAPSVRGIVDAAAAQMGFPSGNAAVAPPASAEDFSLLTSAEAADALVAALATLHVVTNDPLDDDRLARLGEQAFDMPAPVAIALARIIETVPDALRVREMAFAAVGKVDGAESAEWTAPATRFAFGFRVDDLTRALIANTDVPMLVDGARPVASAIDSAIPPLCAVAEDWPVLADFLGWEWQTPLGRIAINTRDAGDEYAADDDAWLIVDFRGDDHYRLATDPAKSPRPLRIVIDLAGNDTYSAGRYSGIGVGVFGYGFGIDVAGDDTIDVPYLAPGSGAFGVGVFLDASGNDKTTIRRYGIGAGTAGIGAFVDAAGDDSFLAFQMSQGYAGPRGCGLLADLAGNDTFVADDTTIDFPSAQTKEHNVSLSQGFGFGRRAHPGDGFSLAGGVGVLFDGGGDDEYSAGVFAQGAGYWYGMGMLVDRAGNDKYRGVWYGQGTAAHYAVGALIEMAGDDHYFASMHQCQGAGHDYSNGYLRDDAGDDVYETSGGSSHGMALWNGIGVLWDRGDGIDKYIGGGTTLGAVGASRPAHRCAGLFLDEGGANEFSTPDAAIGNGKFWRREMADGYPNARGIGWAK